MSMNKNQNTDFLDDMFRNLENDNLDQSIDEFASVVKRQITDSLKKNGYDSASDALLHGVESGFQGRKTAKPDINATSRKTTSISNTRYDYFISLLSDVIYDRNYRGYYKDGHEKAIDIYRSKAEFCKNDLLSLESEVAKEIHRTKLNRKVRDRFEVGYYDGLVFIEKALKRSKLYMMTRIKDEMEML